MDIHQLLIKYWGHSQFRSMQEEIIQSVIEGHDTLALMPTGGGKSLCYQVPGLAMEGVCIVVSPLIALIKDQVQQLEKRKIPVAAVYSGMSFREIDKTLDLAVDGKIKFLYVSPERLQTEIFKVRASMMKVNLIAVDEAHCISQWGFDFRPSYMKIAMLRELLPDVPVMALTATATQEVQDDIVQSLQFRNGKIFIKSFERKNLSYSVLKEENKMNRVVSMIQKVPGTAIVFINSRRKTVEVSDFLKHHKINSTFYHAGLDMLTRSLRQQQWLNNEVRVMVCTNAFGMGIDKPDVRLVVHFQAPNEIESYFQEAGRAGRDDKKSFAVCLFDNADLKQLDEKNVTSFPSTAEIKKVYQSLANYFSLAAGAGEGVSFDFDITVFCKTYQLKPVITFNALKIIEQSGYIALSDAVLIPSRVMIKLDREGLYKFELTHPNLEQLIKTILRMYGGVFDYYSNIREADIARTLNTDADTVISQLKILHQFDLIDYVQAKDKPQLTFIFPRSDAKYLEIDEAFLAKRKKIFAKKIASMKSYLETKWKCRSQMLLQYFGEEEAPRCGICDVCLKRHELDQSDIEFEKNMGIIKAILMTEVLSTDQLQSKLPQLRVENLALSVRWLMDAGLIIENEKGKLRWKQ